MKTLIGTDPIIKKAHDKYIQFTTNNELLDMYEAREKWVLQRNLDLAHAHNEGREEGREEEREELALKMIKKGYSIDEVADLTGLSSDKIKEIVY